MNIFSKIKNKIFGDDDKEKKKKSKGASSSSSSSQSTSNNVVSKYYDERLGREKFSSSDRTEIYKSGEKIYNSVSKGKSKTNDLDENDKADLYRYMVSSGLNSVNDFNSEARNKYRLEEFALKKTDENGKIINALSKDYYDGDYVDGKKLYEKVSTNKLNSNTLTEAEKCSMYRYLVSSGRNKINDFNEDARNKYSLEQYDPNLKSMTSTSNTSSSTSKKNDENSLVDTLASLGEKLSKNSITNGLMNFAANTEMGSLGLNSNEAWAKYLKTQKPEDLQTAQDADEKLKEFMKVDDRARQGNAFTKDFAQYVPQLFHQAKYSAPLMTAGAATGAGTGFIAGNATGVGLALPEEVITVPGGAIAGAKAGYVAGSTGYGFDVMAGEAYKTMLDMGVPNDVAKQVATSTGVINSLIEGAGSAVDLVTAGLAGKAAKSVKEEVSRKTMKTILKDAVKAYGINLAEETAEESAQEGVSILGENYAANKTDIDYTQPTASENAERIAEAGKGGFNVAMFMGLGNAGVNVGVNAYNNKQYKTAVNDFKDAFTSQANILKTVTEDEQKFNQSVADGSFIEAADIMEQATERAKKNYPELGSYLDEQMESIRTSRNYAEEQAELLGININDANKSTSAQSTNKVYQVGQPRILSRNTETGKVIENEPIASVQSVSPVAETQTSQTETQTPTVLQQPKISETVLPTEQATVQAEQTGNVSPSETNIGATEFAGNNGTVESVLNDNKTETNNPVTAQKTEVKTANNKAKKADANAKYKIGTYVEFDGNDYVVSDASESGKYTLSQIGENGEVTNNIQNVPESQLTKFYRSSKKTYTQFGEAGNKEYKSISYNEHVDVDLEDVNNKATKDYKDMFERYYNAGREGVPLGDVYNGEIDNNYPPFIIGRVYKAGTQDAKTQGSASRNKQASTNEPSTKTQNTTTGKPTDTTQDNKTTQSKTTSSENSNFGKNGDREYKSISHNEYVNVDLNDTTDEATKEYIELFERYYNAGKAGVDQVSVFNGYVDTNYPPTIIKRIYEAGQKDTELEGATTDNKKSKKQKPTKQAKERTTDDNKPTDDSKKESKGATEQKTQETESKTKTSKKESKKETAQETKDNVQKTEDNVQKTEDNVQKTEDNVQKTEDNVQKTEDNVQKTEDNAQIKLEEKTVSKNKKEFTDTANDVIKEHFGELLENSKTKKDTKDIILDAFDYAQQHETIEPASDEYEAVFNHIYSQIEDMLSNATVVTGLSERDKAFLDYLRTTPIEISDEIKNDITDWHDFYKSNFGSFELRKDGMPIDVVYEEMKELFPEYVDPEITNQSDMLQELADTVSRIRKDKEQSFVDAYLDGNSEFLNEYSAYFAASIMDDVLLADQESEVVNEEKNKGTSKKSSRVQEEVSGSIEKNNGTNKEVSKSEVKKPSDGGTGGPSGGGNTSSNVKEETLKNNVDNDNVNVEENSTKESENNVQNDDNGVHEGTEPENVQKTESNEQTESGNSETESVGDGDIPGNTGQSDRGKAEERNDAERVPEEDKGNRKSEKGNNRSSKSDDRRTVDGYRINPDSNFDKATKVSRYNANIKAIKLLQTLESENRKATAEEMDILAAYTGWGGLKEVFVDNKDKAWQRRAEELKGLLTPEQYKSARASSDSAFYTPIEVIQSMYSMLENMGVKSNNNILEPSCGVGSFFGLMPDNIRKGANITGVELDSITGSIAKYLYPNADIKISGFEKVNVQPNSLDVVIGNVPFGNISVYDKQYKQHKNLNIHDFFILKSLDSLREGGVMVVLTTSGTLDKMSADVRKQMDEKANLVSAFRLPSKTFSNTDVVTDLIIMQKKGEGVVETNNSFINLSEVDGIKINEYFAEHPTHILGELSTTKNQYGEDVMTVTSNGTTLADVIDTVPKNLITKQVENNSIKADETVPTMTEEVDTSNMEIGTVFKSSTGKLMIINEHGNPEALYKVTKSGKNKGKKTYIKPSSTEYKRVEGMLDIADKVDNVLAVQEATEDDAQLKAAQEELNKVYDKFVKEYGNINDSKNKRLFSSDNRYYKIASIEDVKYVDGEQQYKKGDIFTKRTLPKKKAITSVSSAKDALIASLNMTGGVNIDYMSELYGKDKDSIIFELGDNVYELPDSDGNYVIAGEYLSGNVKQKLKEAQEKAKSDPRFERNVKALKSVQPVDLTSDEISVSLGTPWVGTEYIADFIRDIFGNVTGKVKVYYDSYRSAWTFDANMNYASIRYADQKWGTNRMSALKLIDCIVNKKEIKVTDTIDGQTVINYEETQLALAKAEEIKEHFKDWIFKDADRRRDLTDYYNEHFNNIVTRKFNGDYLEMFGSAIELRPHQANAVARILMSGNTLLAHPVGAGKTFAMIGAAQEMKRLGIAQKPLMVVPNQKLGDFMSDYYKMYPNAKILTVTNEDFSPSNRKKMLAKIQTSDFDCIIMRTSSFDMFGFSPEYEAAYVQKQIDDLERAIIEGKEGGMNKKSLSDMNKSLGSLKSKLEELLDAPHDDIVYFDQSGIDAIIVDEAHNFKKLSFNTKMNRIAGVDSSGSKRATHMHMATEYLNNHNKRVVFATATPVSNTIGELYSLIRYMRPDLLKEYNIESFDAWADTFGSIVSNVEMNTTGSKLETKERFSQFNNVPELIKIFKTFADIIDKKDLHLPLPNADMQHIKVECSDILAEYNQYLDHKKANMSFEESHHGGHLLVTQDARMASLDLRTVRDLLIETGAIDESVTLDDLDLPESKINTAVDIMYQEYVDSTESKGTQIVFLDRGTPSSGGSSKKPSRYPFDLYNDLKNKLIAKGVKPSEIAFIQDTAGSKSDEKKSALFEKVNSGEVRFLIGSTAMMGEGMNVQKKAVALHQLDAPLRPSDVEQRNGRIIRQGNQNENIRVYNYSTLNSYDAPTWGMLDRKNKAINQIMNGDETIREISDLSEDEFANMSIEAANNPLMFERKDVSDKLNKLKFKKKNYTRERNAKQDTIANYPKEHADAENTTKLLETTKEVIDSHEEKTVTVNGAKYETLKEASEAIKETVKSKKVDEKPVVVGEYRGLPISIIKKSAVEYDVKLGEGKAFSAINAVMGEEDGGFTTNRRTDTVMLKISNQIKDLDKRIEFFKNKTENLTKAYEDAKATVDEEFKFDDEINKLNTRLIQIDAELRGDVDKIKNTVTNEETGGPTDEETGEVADEETGKVTDEETGKVADEETGEVTDEETGEVLSNFESPLNDAKVTKGAKTKTGKADTKGDRVFRVKKKSAIPKQHELITEMESDYGIVIRKGNIHGGKSVQGQHNNESGEVRLRTANDIPVASHEVAHHLDKTYGLSKLKTINRYGKTPSKRARISEQLKKAGKRAIKDDKDVSPERLRQEGVAEICRMLFSNRDDISEYQDAVDYIRDTVSEKDNALFDKYYDKIYKMASLSDVESVKNDISINEKKRSRKKGYRDMSSKGKVDEFLTKVFDKFRPIDNLQEIAAKAQGKKVEELSDDENFALKAKLSLNGSESMASGTLYYYQTNLKGEKVGKSFKEIVAPVFKTDEMKEDFSTYLVAMRAKDYKRRGMVMPQEYQKYENAIEELDAKYPHFKEVFDELQTFCDNELKLLVDSGIMSKETYLEIKKNNLFYAPLHRIVDNAFGESSQVGTSNRFAASKNVVKRAKGGGETIIDPLETLVNNVYAFRRVANQNDTMLTIANELTRLQREHKGEFGTVITKLIPRMTGTHFDIGSLVKELVEMEVLDETSEEFGNQAARLDKFSTIFKPDYRPKANEVIIYENGKPTVWEVNDKQLFEFLTGINKKAGVSVLRFLNIPTRILRTGVVTSLRFVLRNAFRDAPMSMIQSGTGLKPHDILRGYWSVIKKDQWYKDYIAQGGGTEWHYINDRKQAQRILESFIPKSLVKKLVDMCFHPIETFQDLTEASESGARVAEYRKSVEDKKTKRQAALNARQLSVDFKQSGSHPAIGEINSISAFFNANLQGLYRFGQTWKAHPFKTAFRTMLYIGIPSIIIRSLSALDDESEEAYQALPEWKKNGYFNIPVGDGKFIAIPKPFEYGWIGSTFWEQAMNGIMNDDSLAGKKIASSFVSTFVPTISFNLMAPIWEAKANKDWTGADIENYTDQTLEPRARYDDKTSLISKKIGDIFNLSPKQIDHILKGYGGTFYFDTIYRSPDKIKSLVESVAESDISNVPAATVAEIFRGIADDWTNTGYATYPAQTTDFFELKEQIDQKYNTEKKGDEVSAETEEMYNLFKDYYKEVSDLNKERKEIIKNEDGYLTKKQQKEELKKIHRELSVLCDQALKEYNYIR